MADTSLVKHTAVPDSPNRGQFLSVSYNSASHPKQISLLDTNSQPILYNLLPSNQHVPSPMFSEAQPYLIQAIESANACFICGARAVDKC